MHSVALLIIVSMALAVPLSATAAFVGSSAKQPPQRQRENLCLFARQSPKRPIAVVGNNEAALGAALALCTREVLQNPEVCGSSSSSPPPTQPVMLLSISGQDENDDDDDMSSQNDDDDDDSSTQQHDALYRPPLIFLPPEYPSVEDYQQVLSMLSQDFGTRPILHVAVQGGTHAATSVPPLLNPDVRASISFLGLDPAVVDSRPSSPESRTVAKRFVSQEDAMRWGNLLQRILDVSSSPVAITTDLPTHLAMLQASSLPKSSNNNGGDSWAIRGSNNGSPNNGESMFVQYQYDYDNPFGGSDPLACPSKGYRVPPQAEALSNEPTGHLVAKGKATRADNAHAAAYTALRGSGVDPVSALCVANGVRAVFLEYAAASYPPPSYTWNVVQWVAQYARQASKTVVQEDGLIRKKYVEYGYK